MSVEHATITVVISARRNSKYLAKFLFGLLHTTVQLGRLDVRVVLNEHDEWNSELQEFFEGYTHPTGYRPFLFFRENLQLGRAGLHKYFNVALDPTLTDRPVGDWVIYFCEDHFINVIGWDKLVRATISGDLLHGDSFKKPFPLDPSEPWVIVPKFDNCGAMNHIVSRGFIKAMGGVIGNHGWIDSYINDLMRPFPERVIRMDESLFHDFTHDKPTPMDDSHVQALSTEKGKALPAYEDPRVAKQIEQDQIKLRRALK